MPFSGLLPRSTLGSENPDCGAGRPVAVAGRAQLGHGSLCRTPLAPIAQGRGPPGEETVRVQLCGQIREIPPRCLAARRPSFGTHLSCQVIWNCLDQNPSWWRRNWPQPVNQAHQGSDWQKLDADSD